MYLHLGQSVVVPFDEVIGVFDLDTASAVQVTRSFLSQAEREGRVVSISEELPKSFVLRGARKDRSTVYLSQLSSATLRGRAENNSFE
ncbi:MAG: DUF370 domain-containing protein [Clostridiales bacterium]|nr:DUF370 domain-containing protein [Clostridiales bacterium]